MPVNDRTRPPCVKSDPGVKEALCGRPALTGSGVFISPAFWMHAADPNGTETCGECLSVLRHALEQSELANRRRGGVW